MKISKESLILFFLIVSVMSFGGRCSSNLEEASSDVATVPTYTVTFDHDSESFTTPVQRVKRGETIARPSAPTKTGVEFVGWYINQTHSHRHNFAAPVTQDITLYAKWISRSEYNQLQASSGLTLAQDGTGYSMKRKSRVPITGALTIPETWNGKPITAIGDQALAGTGLTSVTLPDSLTSIGHGAFFSCRSLTSVTLPASLTSIGIQAFFSCPSLTSVTPLPASLTSIGNYAFYGCTSLTSITVNSPTPPSLGSEVFERCSNDLQIKVPPEAVGAYQSASGWSEYRNRISAID